ncbi:hypothetical protein WH7805_04986 [Synechococcus sp. WH 7805]|nr:hypothetical protein WH7805_04986 [Synechococcus sp. WH 7805]
MDNGGKIMLLDSRKSTLGTVLSGCD